MTVQTKAYFADSFLSENDARIRYGFFSRQGGVSRGIYEGLNLGRGSEDAPDNVEENYERLSQAIGANASDIMTLHQVHSPDCVSVQGGWSQSERPKADSMVTDQKNIAIGVLTADCAPVLFYGEKEDGSPVIGAAHAGWKGAIGGVLASTVKSMCDLGTKPETIRAAIGPCIAQASYEVDYSFVERFCEEDPANEKFFKSAKRDGHMMFDLAGFCASQLASAGVKNVAIMDKDTYALEHDFFSFRRTTHRAENDYGRQISVMMIK